MVGGEADQETARQLVEIDNSRSRIHDSLIAQIQIVNRLFDKYGLEPLYQGGESRNEKGRLCCEAYH